MVAVLVNEVLLSTDLGLSAEEVIVGYLRRWHVETVMQRLTESLRCEIRPLCYPKAALFGFALALVMYNALALVQATIDAAHGPDTSRTLSHYYLALEIAQASDGMLLALPATHWVEAAQQSPESFARALTDIAQGMDLTYYAKSPRGPKKLKAKPKHAQRKVHVSSMKVLKERR